MRWHVVAGIVCGLLGVLGVVGGVLRLVVMAYYNVTDGPIEFSYGKNPSLDQIALIWPNVLTGFCTLLSGVTASVAARFWFKQRNKIGALLFVASLLLMGAATALIPHTP